jgi:integrase
MEASVQGDAAEPGVQVQQPSAAGAVVPPWSAAHPYVNLHGPRNPVTAAEKVSHTPTPPKVLSVTQTVILLGEALSYRDKCDLIPYLAIGLFAGLRSSEIETLQWKDLKPLADRPTLTVQAESSKTRQRRVVTMPSNLKAWLEPYRERILAGGPVVCSCWREHFQIITKKAGIVWPHNALRHSFGSYHLAKHRNVGETAHEMGNSPDMVHRHYKELVQPDAAEQFFSILPPAQNSWYWEIFDQTQDREGGRGTKSNPKPPADDIVDQMRDLISRHDSTNGNDSLPGRVVRMKSR